MQYEQTTKASGGVRGWGYEFRVSEQGRIQGNKAVENVRQQAWGPSFLLKKVQAREEW